MPAPSSSLLVSTLAPLLPVTLITLLRLYGRFYIVHNFFIYDHIYHASLLLLTAHTVLTLTLFPAHRATQILALATLATTWISYTLYARRLALDLSARFVTATTVLLAAVPAYFVAAAIATGLHHGQRGMRVTEAALAAAVYALVPIMVWRTMLTPRRAAGYAAAPTAGWALVVGLAVARAAGAAEGWGAQAVCAASLVGCSVCHLTYLGGLKGSASGEGAQFVNVGAGRGGGMMYTLREHGGEADGAGEAAGGDRGGRWGGK